MINYLALEELKTIVADFLASLEDKIFLSYDEAEKRPAIYIEGDYLCLFLKFLKSEKGGSFLKLINLTAVDYKEYFEVVYHTYSDRLSAFLTVKVKISRELAKVPSVTSLFAGVNFEEREVYDLMGIFFIGHPDLRRILLPDDASFHPLRKDYHEEGPFYLPKIERNGD